MRYLHWEIDRNNYDVKTGKRYSISKLHQTNICAVLVYGNYFIWWPTSCDALGLWHY